MNYFAATRQLKIGPGLLIAGFGLIAASVLGFGIATRGPMIGVMLISIPVLGWLLTRRYGGLACAIVLTLTVPYWYTLGIPQAAVFRIAAVCALATAVFARRVRLTVVDAAIGAIIVVTVLGWLLQDNQAGVGKIVLNEMLPLALYISARSLPSHWVRPVLTLIVAAGAVGASTVIYEFLAGHALFIDPNSYSWNESANTIFRPGGFYGSPPGASTVLALSILSGIPLIGDERRARRVRYRLALTTMLVACVLTFTRASLIGLGVGLVVYLWLMRSSLLTPGRLLVAASALFVTVAIVLPQIQSTTIFQRGIVRPGNLTAREGYWSLALPVITASPHNVVFGIGTGRTIIPRQGGTMPATLATAPVLIEHGTHNQYILTTLEEGVVGLATLIVWIAATIWTGVRDVRREADMLSAALVGAVIAFAIIMLANNALLHPPSLAMAALVTGLIVARRNDVSVPESSSVTYGSLG